MSPPKGVMRTTKRRADGSQAVYWYLRTSAGLVPLGRNPRGPDLQALARAGAGEPVSTIKAGSFAALVDEFQSSRTWQDLRPTTQAKYRLHLGKVARAWGSLPVRDLKPVHVARFVENEYSDKPASSNQAVAAIKSMLAFGMERDYATHNAAAGLRKAKERPETVAPWSEAAYSQALAGPAHIARMAVLGRATGQRVGDLCKMRGADRVSDERGEWLRLSITKTGKRAHMVPLDPDMARIIDAWSTFPAACFITRPGGKPTTAQWLQTAFRVWRDEAGGPIAADSVRIHGLRAMAVTDKRVAGWPAQRIAAALGMSLPMVERYSRKSDMQDIASGRRKA